MRNRIGRAPPDYVEEEFDAYLKCGRLEEGFLRLRCEQCHVEKLVAFSCKKRGFCPSCGARRMVETAVLLVDEVLPARPLRQWVQSLPHALRLLLARDPEALTLVQRFGSAMNLNVHFHMIVPDGVYLADGADPPVFRHVDEPGAIALQALLVNRRRRSVRETGQSLASADTRETHPLPCLIGCGRQYVRERHSHSAGPKRK
jgi:hypothetical protein